MDTRECPICNSTEISLVTLPCKHVICIHCYSKWHVEFQNTTCSLCRQDLGLEMISISIQDQPSQNPTPPETKQSQIPLIILCLYIIASILMFASIFFHNYKIFFICFWVGFSIASIGTCYTRLFLT